MRVRTVEGCPVMAVPDIIQALGAKRQTVYQHLERNEATFKPHIHTIELFNPSRAEGLAEPAVRGIPTKMIDRIGMQLLIAKLELLRNARMEASRFYSWAVEVLKGHINDNSIDGSGVYLGLLDEFIQEQLAVGSWQLAVENMARRFRLLPDRLRKFVRTRRVELGLPPVRGEEVVDVYILLVPDQLECAVCKEICKSKNGKSPGGNIAENLGYFMQYHKIDFKELAVKVSIGEQNLRSYVSGKQVPREGYMIRLCKFFGVSVQGLIG